MQNRPSLQCFVLGSLLLPVLTAAPAAQDPALPQGPAPEVKKFERWLGAWEGKGEYFAAHDAKPVAFTAREHVAHALQNHFVESVSHVKFEGGMPEMHMRAFWGFDRDNARHYAVGVSNMGAAFKHDVDWVGDDVMLITSHDIVDGKPFVMRETLRFAGDRFDILVEQAIADQPWFVHVKGSMQRSAAAARAADASADGTENGDGATAFADANMQKLARLLGTWRFEGKMRMAPDADAIAVTGTETNTVGFGGHVIVHHMIGDPASMAPGAPPMGYEAWSFGSWNETRKAFVYVMADSMGQGGKMETWPLSDDEFVTAMSGKMQGVPSACRALMRFTGDANAPVKWAADRLRGTDTAYREFEGSYKRQTK